MLRQAVGLMSHRAVPPAQAAQWRLALSMHLGLSQQALGPSSSHSKACMSTLPLKQDHSATGGTALSALVASAVLGAAATTTWADSEPQAAAESPSGSDQAAATSKPTFGEKIITPSRPLELYQYESCPWCNKVKASLDYHDVPYRTIEVHPVFKRELSATPFKKVPVVVTPSGQAINESDVIVDCINEYKQSQLVGQGSRSWIFGKRAAKQPKSFVANEEEQRWLDWANNKFVHCLTATIYSSFQESCEAMEYIRYIKSFSMISQELGYVTGAIVMRLVGSRLPKKYGLEGKDLFEELTTQAHAFIDAIGDRKFMGGDTPNRADLAVFGFLRAVSTTATFRKLIVDEKFLPWWTRMIDIVGESAQTDDFLPDEKASYLPKPVAGAA